MLNLKGDKSLKECRFGNEVENQSKTFSMKKALWESKSIIIYTKKEQLL